MDPLEIEFAAYDGLLSVVGLFGLAFLLALVSETVWDVLRGNREKWGETAANIAIGLVSAVLERTAYGIVFIVGLVFASYFAVFDLPNGWWTIPLAVIVADFTYYWMHRAEHEIRLFWANHSVHHSSPEFNFTTALRISWMDALIEWIFFIPMVLMGFSVVETVIGLIVVVAYQSWIHTEKVGKLGWFDRVFNTPSAHRVHHGSNPEYIDKNYGGMLIIWDRMFGTYEPEVAPVVYGITVPINTHNPVVINFKEYRDLVRDVARAKTWQQAIGYVLRGPGWQPDQTKEDT
ncbi:MAG: sterol desaturase family protein [Pseudomonadota bacterium]